MTEQPEFIIVKGRQHGQTIYYVAQAGNEIARFSYKSEAKRFVSKQELRSAELSGAQ